MIINYLKTALRNFQKHKSFTFLNVLGLALGTAASLLILQYVKYERSFDTFNTKAQDIYRIQYNSYSNGKQNFECAAAVPAVGPALKNNFPEVKRFTRLYPVSGIVSYEGPTGLIAFREEKMQITDTSVFEVFDFKLVKGDPKTALKGPDKVVISEKAAKKYFGNVDPIGKIIGWDGQRKYEVTAIHQDVPSNSHIKFDFLFSYETLNRDTKNQSETNWGWYDFNTYVLLEPGTDAAALQLKWNEYLEKTRAEDWKKYNFKQAFLLQPLLSIHLYSKLLQESNPEEQGDGKSIYALTLIAFFILIIAWVNYINLATAKSFDRANEVGVRKVMGAQKGQLIYQFLSESFLVNLLATSLAILIVRLAWPAFSALSGREVPLSFMMQTDFWTLVGLLFAGGAVLSGFYPAIILSSFKPVSVLKGKVMRTAQGNVLRKSLVVFQFVSSIVLIIGSIVVYQQLNFMNKQDLGIDINKTLVIKGPGAVDSLYNKNFESFKTEALRISGVKNMTASSNVPGDEIFWTRGIKRLSGGPESRYTTYIAGIDEDYVSSYDLKILAGRNFSKDFKSDRKAIILNQSLMKQLEFKTPQEAIGQKVNLGDTLEIIGILEDYHQMSLKNSVTPIAFRSVNTSSFYSFKIEGDNHKAVLAAIEGPWKTFFPGNPIDYFFLDQFFNRQYKSDIQFANVFTIFTGLAIFVACMGLFGLASFMTIQRTKEIGVRKVLGSSVTGIVILLSRGFVQLVLVANLIAWPLAWWVMDRWLGTFPYRIDINPFVFVGAGLAVVVIAFLSVGFQTLKSARVNPAQTLKYE
ncbi:ABC transporter permease [Cytophagales bacterium WSM2-2]|nr:ABC transporter permease [Cytophagales bacterium WSM2-2]